MQLAADTHEADTIRQSIVVLMGTLAKHMDKENPKVSQWRHTSTSVSPAWSVGSGSAVTMADGVPATLQSS